MILTQSALTLGTLGQMPEAVEAAPGGAEAREVAFVFGLDDTPASPPLADQGPSPPTTPPECPPW